MSSERSGSGDSSFPIVFGAVGAIDLTGGVAPQPADLRPSSRPSGDAWVVDRDRRSMRPPSIVPVPESEAPQADIHHEIADRFALGDYAAALSSAELQLGLNPDDEDARQYADTSRERLETRYVTRIGSVDFVFNLSVPQAKVKWLGLDPQAAFLLSLVDGQTTVAEVLDLCQMPRLEALRVFTELLEAKAIVRVA